MIVCVGDVHGSLDECKELLRTIQYRPEQMRLIFLGDLVDRGPDSIGCVKFVRELKAECLLGNHEEKYTRFARNEQKRLSFGIINKMKLSSEKMKIYKGLSADDLNWMHHLPLKLDLENGWTAIHGGLEPGKMLDEQEREKIIRVRYVSHEGVMVPTVNKKSPGVRFWTRCWDGKESIIYGHTVHSLNDIREDVRKNDDGSETVMLGIDTGCCFGGRLTAVLFHPEGKREIVQVPSRGRYADYWGSHEL
jgi:hypothetical protein